MARAIDSEAAYQFLTDQLVKETGAFSRGVNKGLNIARSAMRNPDAMPTLTPPNEWARVKERLPEKKQDVLMLFNAGNMAVGWLNDTDWCAYTDDGFYTDCDSAPIYWMPLPKPPKGSEDVAENATTAERCAWHEWIKERFGGVR